MLHKQETLMAEGEEVVVGVPVVAVVPAVDNDTLLDVNEGNDWEL